MSSTPQIQQLHWQGQVQSTHAGMKAVDYLHQQTQISKVKLKDALAKGACVYLQPKAGKSTWKPLRRASRLLNTGDQLKLAYDAQILALTPPQPECLYRHKAYSLWFKPAGLLSQASLYGDHCTLLRQAELQLGHSLWLTQRLDREASGLILLAHQTQAAAQINRLLQTRQLAKTYHVQVQGLCALQTPITLEHPLDGKTAITHLQGLQTTPEGNTWLSVRIETGRKHQIRRHLAHYGHPVLGDPRYGSAPHPQGLQLQAIALKLPWQKQNYHFQLAELAPHLAIFPSLK
ncbi:tRNA pseudouridine32 synthase / 23S rRNA pseudouridine746 synthase [Allopseudospirillum japonicum]|uniref:tRNA pseudouridine32 synthase / 23S rRNA pseudouridine746 synthase n=1 Tax=Allopseudospirillum japonicum TaxID=64971 RepID=A0A1H6Q0P0_9GAMM|nr:RNA pseudouridine synthase [Allopseudospirillum japonicum]SEI37429.1 tRNA pseudouridine32 synthase / 23S rRNA pseudouridine746 synthase [Allopseudospirillum japonicum]